MVSPLFNGALLRQLRKKAGFSLRDLAGEFYRHFKHYMTYQTINLWEQGRSQPKGHHLVMLAKIFEVEEMVFYEGGEEDTPPAEIVQHRAI